MKAIRHRITKRTSLVQIAVFAVGILAGLALAPFVLARQYPTWHKRIQSINSIQSAVINTGVSTPMDSEKLWEKRSRLDLASLLRPPWSEKILGPKPAGWPQSATEIEWGSAYLFARDPAANILLVERPELVPANGGLLALTRDGKFVVFGGTPTPYRP